MRKNVLVVSASPRRGGNSGCGACIGKKGDCPQKDDMAGILRKMIAAADTRKKAMERTLEGFRGFTSCLDGATEKGVVYGTGAWEAGDIQKSKAMT